MVRAEGTRTTCRNCGHEVEWVRDDPNPEYGFWATVEHGWDLCPATVDGYHEGVDDED